MKLHQSKVPPIYGGAAGSGGNASDAREIQEVCMQVVTIAANDSVLKVFLAALVSCVHLSDIGVILLVYKLSIRLFCCCGGQWWSGGISLVVSCPAYDGWVN